MYRLLLFLIAASALTVRADDAVNKLLAGHDQAVQSVSLPLHRKLLAELQKLETRYTSAGQKVPAAETQTQIERIKQTIAEASQPVGSGAGPQPTDFKLIYGAVTPAIFGSWENGELKPLPRGFTWANKSGHHVGMTYTTVLKGAFEAEFTWKGGVRSTSLNEADYFKYVHFYAAVLAVAEKHTLKVKRTAAGAISATLDGQPLAYVPNEGARQDMHVRFMFYVENNTTVEFQDAVIKDLSAKK